MTKDSLIVLMAKDVCIELNKLVDEKKSTSNLESDMGMAMIPAFGKYMTEIMQIYGFNKMNEENWGIVGEAIGGELAKSCPTIFTLLGRNPEATSDLMNGRSNNSPTNSVLLEGTIEKITNTELSYIEVKSSKGKIEKLYWLEYFEGSNDLINSPNKLLQKPVKITFVEKEIYKSSLKEYIKIKVIAGIQLKL